MLKNELLRERENQSRKSFTKTVSHISFLVLKSAYRFEVNIFVD